MGEDNTNVGSEVVDQRQYPSSIPFATPESPQPMITTITTTESTTMTKSPIATTIESPSPSLGRLSNPSRKDKMSIRSPHSKSLPQLCNLNDACVTDANQRIQTKPLLVLKVGTSTILETTTASFCLSSLGKFVDCICNIKKKGYQVVIVSSGAVGAGVIHMKLKERPTSLKGKQAASAVGQCRLMRLYEDLFAIHEQKVGQLILTRIDLMDRARFINFKQTLKELLRLDVVPIINENDAFATVQLRFGDNDTLAAYVAVSLSAQWLFLLTDVDCLYTKNPRYFPDAKPIPYVGRLDDVYQLLDNDKHNVGTSWGSGGMRTKIVAAKIASATGIHTALCCGQHPERILDIIAFAETYGHTTEDWERALNNWYKRQSVVESSIMKPSRSSGNLKGLQHHHHHGLTATVTDSVATSVTLTKPKGDEDNSEYLDRTVTASTMSSSSSSITITASLSHNEGSGSASLEADQHDGLVTVENLGAMPYLATIFGALECTQKIQDQRRWILSLPVRGSVYIDEGAARAIVEGKKSLFAAGITKVKGQFYESEAVSLILDTTTTTTTTKTTHSSASNSPELASVSESSGYSSSQQLPTTTRKGSVDGLIYRVEVVTASDSSNISSPIPCSHSGREIVKSRHYKEKRHYGRPENPISSGSSSDNEDEIARCLVDFSSNELDKIKGLRSEKFHDVLGYDCDHEVAHRHNIIFVNPCAVFHCSPHHACSHH